MNQFAVTVLGADRPGIVASVAEVLTHQGCNLQDTSMTILGGHFAMMLLVDGDPAASAASLEASLDKVAEALEVVVSVRPVAPLVPVHDYGSDAWTVAVYGADHPGIVSRVARFLADRSANIVDLSTRVIGPADRPVYAMVLEVTLPAASDAHVLGADLAVLAGELGVSCSLHPSDADIL